MKRTRSESMAENRGKLIAAARKAFAEKGYADASMDALTAEAGLTRGASFYIRLPADSADRQDNVPCAA